MTTLSKTQQQVADDFGKITRGDITYEIAHKIRERVLQIYCPDGEGDPESPDPEVREFGRLWCTSARAFFNHKDWNLPCENLLLTLWEVRGRLQLKRRKHVSRAFIAQLLTEAAHHMRNPNEAVRWSLLAHADDVLGESPSEGVYSRHWLYGAYGVSDTEKAELEEIAKNCRWHAVREGWDAPVGFAEEAVRRLAYDGSVGETLLGRYPMEEEFPISRAFVGVLLKALKQAASSYQKGKTLEALASYLFHLISGAVPRCNVLDKAGASEYDLVVGQRSIGQNTLSSWFENSILVECKNWNHTIGVSAVGYFLLRMHLTHCRYGVILSKRGITEKPGADAYADALTRRAFHEDGSTCVVVTLKDINDLAAGRIASFMGLLTERASRLRFGNTK